MLDLFFDLPLWAPIALLAAAAALFVYGNNRSQPRLRLAALGVLLLTGVLLAVSYMVDTFQEKCVKRTAAIVKAVNDRDWPSVRLLVNESTRVVQLQGREQITTRGKELSEEWGLKFARIIATDIRPGTPGMLDVRVSIWHEFEKVPVPRTTWEFRYAERADGIELTGIAPLQIGDQPVNEIEQRLR